MKTQLLFSSFPFLAGDKVTLARMTELDLKNLWLIMGDEQNFRYSPTAALRNPNECILKLRQAESLFREKRAVVLGIYPNEGEHQLAGTLEITVADPKINCVNLSFRLARRFTGQGFASSAVRCASSYLMETIGANRIQAYVMPNDYRGALVLEACGFQKEGTIREGFLWPDKGLVDLTLYSLLPSDRRPKAATQSYYL